MAIKIIVFDFDGTLIDSNRLKYDAFFELFADDQNHVDTIRKVLADKKEQSRFVIIEEILRRLGHQQTDGLKEKLNHLAARYNDLAVTGAKACPELPGADAVLRSLNRRYRLYLSSTTPEEPLKEIVEFRGWTRLFEDVFGYPRRKVETIQQIFDLEKVTQSEVLVVGDGESDRQSALENGCYFTQVTEKFKLADLEGILKGLSND